MTTTKEHVVQISIPQSVYESIAQRIGVNDEAIITDYIREILLIHVRIEGMEDQQIKNTLSFDEDVNEESTSGRELIERIDTISFATEDAEEIRRAIQQSQDYSNQIERAKQAALAVGNSEIIKQETLRAIESYENALQAANQLTKIAEDAKKAAQAVEHLARVAEDTKRVWEEAQRDNNAQS